MHALKILSAKLRKKKLHIIQNENMPVICISVYHNMFKIKITLYLIQSICFLFKIFRVTWQLNDRMNTI